MVFRCMYSMAITRPSPFAAGKVTGSVHGNDRVGTCAIFDITVFGRIAGRNAANNKQYNIKTYL